MKGQDQKPLRIVHCIGPDGAPQCPKCGQGLESQGGSVRQEGQWDWGPYYWYCEDCDYQWGHS